MNDSSDELSQETRDLLDRGRHGHALSPGRRSGLRRAVLAQAALGTVIATSSTAAAWTAAVNAASVAVIVLFVGGTLRAAMHRNDPVERPTAAAMPAPPRTPARVAPVDALPAEAPKAVAAPGAPPVATPAPGPAPLSEVVAPSSPQARPGSLPVAPGARATPPAAAQVAASSAPGASLAVPATTPTQAASPMEPPSAPTGAPSSLPVVPVSSLAAEAQLLREADRALKAGDAAGCLQLLDEHARQFPRGTLEPEASAERVLALCGAGRTSEATRDARAFLASHEAGPLALRVRASCAGPGL